MENMFYFNNIQQEEEREKWKEKVSTSVSDMLWSL